MAKKTTTSKLSLFTVHQIRWASHNIATSSTSAGSGQGKTVCPWQQKFDDLQEQVEVWQHEGDQVFFLADINKDIQEENIDSTFQCMSLVEAVISQHTTHGPNTHNEGQNPIDGIFTPKDLVPSIKSRCYAFGEGICCNHYALWLNIPLLTLGWFSTSASAPLKAHWLKCIYPCIVDQYNKLFQLSPNRRSMRKLIIST